MNRTMKFDYRKNCTVVHFTPRGEEDEGRPVMVIPKNALSVVAGRTYEVQLDYSYKKDSTEPPTYILDGVEYRVVHATILREVDGSEGTQIDAILYGPREKPRVKLADRLDPAVRAKLEAMRRAS